MDSQEARDLLWLYFRSPENSRTEKLIARQFDRKVETGKRLPSNDAKPRVKTDLRATRVAWRNNNRERWREINRNWQRANRSRVTASQKNYVARNLDKVRQWKINWKKRNPEKVRLSQQKWRAKKKLDKTGGQQ